MVCWLFIDCCVVGCWLFVVGWLFVLVSRVGLFNVGFVILVGRCLLFI